MLSMTLSETVSAVDSLFKSGLIETSGGYDYSSTQIPLTPQISAQLRNFQRFIPDSALAADGREKNPHITVKYGLHTDDVAEVKKIFAGVRPIRYTLGKVSMFECKDYNVLKVDIDSPDLHAANARVKRMTKCTDTHPTYQPHATIAYVKKNFKIKAPMECMVGIRGVADVVEFSAKNNKVTKIPLRGASRVSAIIKRTRNCARGNTHDRGHQTILHYAHR